MNKKTNNSHIATDTVYRNYQSINQLKLITLGHSIIHYPTAIMLCSEKYQFCMWVLFGVIAVVLLSQGLRLQRFHLGNECSTHLAISAVIVCGPDDVRQQLDTALLYRGQNMLTLATTR